MATSKACLGIALVTLATSCQSPEAVDYSNWLANPPRSILVLPPLNSSVETQACYGALSTLTQPLAERGFYVFPVAVVDALMRENGLPTPHEMHSVSLGKIREIFAPDAVLYLEIQKWGTSYQILASTSTVALSGRLVDARTGDVLWTGADELSQGSGGGGAGLVGMLAGALVTQVARSISDPSVPICRGVSTRMIGNPANGFLPGPYHAKHEEALAKRRADLDRQEAQTEDKASSK